MAHDQERSMEARVGRDNQRYGSQGERLVAGIVPLSADRKSVLLIQSVRRNAWVLPKGGWETDETVEQAACREAWEEAGAVCNIHADLGEIPERRRPDQLTATAPKAAYHFFEAEVEKEEDEWPERHKRNRRWMGYKEAIELLKERPELSEALNRSSIDKSC